MRRGEGKKKKKRKKKNEKKKKERGNMGDFCVDICVLGIYLFAY
jgi:hypothetical protein